MSLSTSTFIWEHLTTRITAPDVDLTGRVCLVTGGNQGLGYATVVHFARMNASHIIIACRQIKKGEEAARNAYAACPDYRGKISAFQLDLASFASVKTFAKKVETDLGRLDIAVLNAGIAKVSWDKTSDGWEETLQVNYLSTGLLAMLLLPKLVATNNIPLESSLVTGKKGLDKPHLAIMASGVHYWAQFKQKDAPVLLEALNDQKQHDRFDTYNMSKLLDVFLARQIASLPSASTIVVNCIDPGLCKSELRRDVPFVVAWLINLISWKTSFGSRNSVIAAVTNTTPGALISNGVERPVASYVTSDHGAAVQKKLWGESVELWKGLAPEITASP